MADPNFSPTVRSTSNMMSSGEPGMPTFVQGKGLRPQTYYEQDQMGRPVKVTISRKGNVYRNLVYPSGFPASMINQQAQQADPFANPISEEKMLKFLGARR